MRSQIPIFALLVGGLAALAPESADAQVAVQVHVYWESDGGRWQPGGVEYLPPRGRYRGARSVRVPPGHLPPPGYCRLWLPGTPPGHQPRPERCDRVFRAAHHHPGAVVIGPRSGLTRASHSRKGKKPKHEARWDW